MMTLNNWSEPEYQAILVWMKAKAHGYAIGKEIGEQGTPHLQMCIWLKLQTRWSAIHRKFPRMWMEPCKDWNAAMRYCQKDGDAEALEHSTSSQGRRSELKLARRRICDHDTWSDVVCDEGLDAVLQKHMRWARVIFAHRVMPVMTGLMLRAWQQRLLERILTPPNDREIMWVYGKGGEGKTTMARLLARNHGAFLASGKAADVLYGYSDQKIIVFEYPKHAKEFVSYGAIEKIKDGAYFVGKYESHMHVRTFNAHVLVLANFEPDKEKMTADRWSYTVNLDDLIM